MRRYEPLSAHLSHAHTVGDNVNWELCLPAQLRPIASAWHGALMALLLSFTLFSDLAYRFALPRDSLAEKYTAERPP